MRYLANGIAGDTTPIMDVNKIEYHLEFYTQAGEQIEHSGNMKSALITPRQGERVCFLDKKKTFEVTRVSHNSRTTTNSV